MKKQEIISVLYELYKITGFRMSLHDVDSVEIAAYPENAHPFCARIHEIESEKKLCCEYDKIAFKTVLETKEPLIYKCRYGLTEAISPLYNFGILTGFLMMGQIREEGADPEVAREGLIKLGVEPNEAAELVMKTQTVSEDMIRSYVKIMTVCAQYLTLSNAMPGARPSIAEAANKYIHENVDKKLTIKDICKEVGCTKTTLISTFKKEFGLTVNDAIIASKLEEAKKLLIAGSMSICEIANATGFYDQSYFSKVFSQQTGLTPSDYRKEHSK